MLPASMLANFTVTGLLLLLQVMNCPGVTRAEAAEMLGHVNVTLLLSTVSVTSAFATVTAVLPVLVSVAVYVTFVPAINSHVQQ
jgi:hypothetical protein